MNSLKPPATSSQRNQTWDLALVPQELLSVPPPLKYRNSSALKRERSREKAPIFSTSYRRLKSRKESALVAEVYSPLPLTSRQ
jgi:hypothetical protein